MKQTKIPTHEQQGTDESFLSRWSRRKLESNANAAADNLPPPAATQTPAETNTEILPDDSDMPPVESLNAESEISGFLSPQVSDTLRRRALRKVFLSDKFNVRDGLDDYDEDFTSFTPLGDVVTAEMRRWRERMRNLNKDEESDSVDVSEDTPAETDAEADSHSVTSATADNISDNLPEQKKP